MALTSPTTRAICANRPGAVLARIEQARIGRVPCTAIWVEDVVPRYVFRASVPASATALDQDTKPIWARSIGAWPIRQFRHALGWWHGPASGSTVRIALQSSFTDRIVRAAGTAPPRRRRSRPQPAHNHRRPPVTARDRGSSTRCHTQAQRHSARTHSLAESQQQPEKAQRKACRRTAAAQQPQGLIAVATHRSMWRP